MFMKHGKCCSLVLNYNSMADTKKLVFNLQEIDEINEIVIVDNNSPDNSFSILKNFFKEDNDVFIIKTEKNRGYSYGNNYGAKFIIKFFDPKYILICNPDVEIPKNFVKNMVIYLENDIHLAAVSGLMLNYRNELDFSRIAWKIPNILSCIFMNLDLLVKIYNPIMYHHLDLNGINKKVGYVECLPGSCFVIKTEILRQVGFYDENIFLYYEENILGKKIKNMGLVNGLSINDFFMHKHRFNKSTKKFIEYYLILNKSKLYYILKYTKFGKILSPIFIISVILGLLEIILVNLFKIVKQNL